jgi:uncharacterized membrane protein
MTGSINRYALPVTPIMIMVVAYLINKLLSKKRIGYFLLIILIIYSLLFSILLDIRLLKNDTRQLARNWIISNIPSGSVINNNNLNENLDLNESLENIVFIRESFPEMMSTKRNYLLTLSEVDYPKPSYFLIIYDYDKRVELDAESDYIIRSNFNKDELEVQSKDIPENYQIVASFFPTENNSEEILKRNELDAPFNEREFNPWSLLKSYDYYGPFIEIYKLNNNVSD